MRQQHEEDSVPCCKLDMKIWIIIALVGILAVVTVTAMLFILQLRSSNDQEQSKGKVNQTYQSYLHDLTLQATIMEPMWYLC